MSDKPKKEKADYYIPISSYEDYLKNMKHYMEYGIITYYSNFKLQDDYDQDCLYRFVYENKLKNNIEEIEKLSGKKFATVMRNVRKLSKMDNNLVVASNSPNGIVYTLNYYTMPHGYYVVIHHDILRFLLNASNEYVIKLYVYLKYRCSKGETKVTLNEMADAIGLSPKCKNNLQIITDITTMLDKKLIKKRYQYDNTVDSNGNFTTKRFCYYTVMTYEEFKEMYNKSNGK